MMVSQTEQRSSFSDLTESTYIFGISKLHLKLFAVLCFLVGALLLYFFQYNETIHYDVHGEENPLFNHSAGHAHRKGDSSIRKIIYGMKTGLSPNSNTTHQIDFGKTNLLATENVELSDNRRPFTTTSTSEENDTTEKLVKSLNPCPTGSFQTEKISELKRADSGLWKKLHYEYRQSETFMFSAFYDDRLTDKSVTILAFSTYTDQENFTCQVYYEDMHVPYVVPASKMDMTMEGFSHNNVRFFQTRFICSLHKTLANLTAPKHVTLVRSPCEIPIVMMEIYDPRQDHPTTDIGICLALSHGSGTTIENWVEWLEYNKFLGIKEVNVYNCSVPSQYDKMFEYYIKQGMIRLVQMPAPLKMPVLREGCFVTVQMCLNDCLLRNMYRYKFQAFIDADEFITYQKDGYSDIVPILEQTNAKLNIKEEVWQYTFRNEFHFLEYKPDPNKPKYLRTMTYRKHIAPADIVSKSFVNPLHCNRAFNHVCLDHIPHGTPAKTVRVPTEIAVLQHYRVCPGSNVFQCDQVHNTTTFNDTNILKYEKVLVERVTGVLKLLNITI